MGIVTHVSKKIIFQNLKIIKMTREELIKHWEFIEGFKNGREIQWYDDDNEKWHDAKTPSFCVDTIYRFKQEPKYIPFDFTDAENLIGKCIKSKDGNIKAALITHIYEDGIKKTITFIDYSQLFEEYTFLDGSTCGKLCQ